MLNKPNSAKEQIIELYTKGLSTRQIAPLVSLSYSYIHKLLKSWGLYRSKSEAAILRHLRPERKEYMRAYLKKYIRKVKSAS